MHLNTPQMYILYLLGLIFHEFERQQGEKPLELALSKSDFIKIARRAELVSKQERAMYKNLETLEQLKYISYDKNNLYLTKAGKKLFEQKIKEVTPYVRLTVTISAENLMRYAKRAQTKFKNTSLKKGKR